VRRLALAALALVALGGCRADVGVSVDSRADGTGRVRVAVTLDAEAAARVPDLADQLKVDDLTAAGWEVEGPEPTEDGGVEVRASKRFRSPREATQVVEEVTGPDGPFRNFRLRRSRSFLKTSTTLEGTVDLTGGIEAFSDESLRRRLGGSALGFDPADLERRSGTTLSDTFGFHVGAELPGEVEANTTLRSGNRVGWTPELGESMLIRASSEAWNTRNIAAAAVSALAALAFLAIVVQRIRHRR
jgi:hypothetical protein